MMRGVCHAGKRDPGPCPVDDTPHTACTPESVATQHATALVVTTIQRPRVLDQMPQPEPMTFTTKTYKRATHGRTARAALAKDR
jgi:hypothetical protein